MGEAYRKELRNAEKREPPGDIERAWREINRSAAGAYSIILSVHPRPRARRGKVRAMTLPTSRRWLARCCGWGREEWRSVANTLLLRVGFKRLGPVALP